MIRSSGALPTSSQAVAENDRSMPKRLCYFMLVLVAILYSGLTGLLTFFFSPYLYTAFYLMLFMCIFLYLLTEKQKKLDIGSISPYLMWIVFYCFWGIVVSPNKYLYMADILRMVVRHVLFLLVIIIGLNNRTNLRKLAYLVQIAVIVNSIISIRGFYEPQFVSDLAYSFPNVQDVDQLRPAGLWINPNEASFAFILGFLMSFWVRGVLPWAGRIAAIIGIYLSVSRTGVFLLILCTIIYLIFRIRLIKFNYLQLSLIINGLVLVAILFWLIYSRYDFSKIDITDNPNINRILNYSASLEDDRGYIASLAVRYALNGPWYGYGIFTFQEPDMVPYHEFERQGAHNIYLAVFGEIGVLGLFAYLFCLSIGILRLIDVKIPERERLIVFIMWVSYLILGLAWHNQFTSTVSIVYVGFLFHIPRILVSKSEVISV